jgi:hypothetical protein
MWSATLGNRELTIGSAAIEGKPLGNRRYGWEGRMTENAAHELGRDGSGQFAFPILKELLDFAGRSEGEVSGTRQTQ